MLYRKIKIAQKGAFPVSEAVLFGSDQNILMVFQRHNFQIRRILDVLKQPFFFFDFDFTIQHGERVLLRAANGCGKSSLIKAILRANGPAEKMPRTDLKENGASLRGRETATLWESGVLRTASGLRISYIDQDTSFLQGSLSGYCKEEGLDESLFKAILRQLDLERTRLDGRMEEFSEGQKKKVLIASSLLRQAHLYIWDEPLNYIDVFSRIQIEALLLRYQPTMLFVEHDIRFQEKIATRVVELG